MTHLNTGLSTLSVKNNCNYFKERRLLGRISCILLNLISSLQIKMNSNQLSASRLPWKNSAPIPTLLQFHKPATTFGPPWAHWCERAAFNATSSAQTGKFFCKIIDIIFQSVVISPHFSDATQSHLLSTEFPDTTLSGRTKH